MDGPIWTKFGTLMQNESPKRTHYSKFAFMTNRDGGGRHLEYQLNCDISATVWPISTNNVFGGTLNLAQSIDFFGFEIQTPNTLVNPQPPDYLSTGVG